MVAHWDFYYCCANVTGSADRKELLACLIYVVQNSPDKLLRGLWRHLLSAHELLPDEVANKMVRHQGLAFDILRGPC